MNTSAPANYVIRIDGHLGDQCSASLVGMSIIRDSDGTPPSPGRSQTKISCTKS